MSKITFLGTAGDASVVARQLRASGGIILQSGETQLHLDPGPGSLVRAKEHDINLRANTAILVSHAHLTHCHDLNAVISAITLGGLDKRGVLISNPALVNSSELSDFHRFCLEKIIPLTPEQKVAIEDIEIHATKTSHSDSQNIGFKIITPDFTLGYTSDTAYFKELPVALSNSDILILNTTFPADTKTDNHLNCETAIKLVEKVKPKLAIITHFGFEMLKADPLLEARKINMATGIQTIAAQDGFTITPSSYAAKSDQSRLSKFSKEDQSSNTTP